MVTIKCMYPRGIEESREHVRSEVRAKRKVF